MESAGGVAIAAHLGGFISGFVLTPFLKKSNIKLFQSAYYDISSIVEGFAVFH